MKFVWTFLYKMKNWLILLICVLSLLGAHSPAYPKDKQEITVTNLQPKIIENQFAISASIENLFSRKIVSTIQSGLSSIVRYEINVTESGGPKIFDKSIVYSISYDIWDERYQVETSDTTLYFNTFEQVKAYSSTISIRKLFHSGLFDAEKSYYLQIRAQILPISAEQGHKAIEWLRSPQQSDEILVSGGRASGFQLNVDKMLSFFIGRKSRLQHRSDWYKSDQFTINSEGELIFQ